MPSLKVDYKVKYIISKYMLKYPELISLITDMLLVSC